MPKEIIGSSSAPIVGITPGKAVSPLAQAIRFGNMLFLSGQMLGVFAEFERAMIRERVMAGIARARAEGKTMGRRRVEDSHPNKIKAVHAMRAKGVGLRKIAAEVGLGVGIVLRLVAA
jgi:DNA invertase Pin-like site-specific DNA recombinase